MSDPMRELNRIVDRKQLVEKVEALPADADILVIARMDDHDAPQGELLDCITSGELTVIRAGWLIFRMGHKLNQLADHRA